MLKTTTHVSVKYQVVIPKEIREKIALAPRDELGVFVEDKNTIVLKKIPSSIKDLKGTYKFPKNYLKNERLSW